MASPRRNLEIKARYADLHAAAQRVGQLGARDAGVEVQTDTYFHVGAGRLKLREIEGQPAALIWYARPNESAPRVSAFHLVPVPDAAALKALLAGALGVRGAVRKHRHIWLWQNVRIHLDQVDNLGSFVEFEAMFLSPADEAAAPGRIDQLSRLLAITPTDLLALSYADLLGL